MTTSKHAHPDPPDFIALASARTPELLAVIERQLESAIALQRDGAHAGSPPDEPALIPDAVTQIADFALAETVRLIRLGKRTEIIEAGVAISQLLIAPSAKLLREHYPDAYEVLRTASLTLSSAVSPASKGGELTVLRSWNGKAREAVWHLDRSTDKQLPRAELKDLMGIEESHLSHLLADLETAGLAERIREGRNVTVHLGPRGYASHVQQQLSTLELSQHESSLAANAECAQQIFTQLLADKIDVIEGITGVAELREQLEEVRRDLALPTETIEETIAGNDRIVCRVHVSGISQFREVDRVLVWTARVENDRIAEVASWSSSESFPSRPTHVGLVRETMPSVEEDHAAVVMWMSEISELINHHTRSTLLDRIAARTELDAANPSRHVVNVENYQEADNEIKRWGHPIPSIEELQT